MKLSVYQYYRIVVYNITVMDKIIGYLRADILQKKIVAQSCYKNDLLLHAVHDSWMGRLFVQLN